jgi:hypothetical protein
MFLRAAPLVLICGCASSAAYKAQFVGVEEDLRAHNYQVILAHIDETRAHCYKEKDKVLYYLDTGLLSHFAQDWKHSNRLLEDAESSIENAYSRSVCRAASSMLLNDNVLEYAGEAHEDLYLNIFKALNYVELGKNDEAMVEVRRISNKLNKLEDKNAKFLAQYNSLGSRTTMYKSGRTRFYDSALARYLSMIMYRANGDADDARIDFERIYSVWRNDKNIYSFRMPNIKMALAPSPYGYTKLNVISFTGRLPDKLARTLYIRTQPRNISVIGVRQLSNGQSRQVMLENIPWRGKDPLPAGMQLKFEVPYMQMRPSQVRRIRLIINNCDLMGFNTIETMDKVAFEIFKAKEPLIYMRAVLRTAFKSFACAKAIAELQKQNNGQPVPADIISALFSATEHADLRVSQFFPAAAHICELDVPAGVYEITVVYYNGQGQRLYVDNLGKVHVGLGKLNLLESHYLN